MHHTGKHRDTETNLDDFPARYYSSVQGRWLSPDWDTKPVAVPYAILGNPQTLNLYSYVGGDPTNHADPDGHMNFWRDAMRTIGTWLGVAQSSSGQAGDKAQEQGYTLPADPKDVSKNPNWKKDPKFDPQGKTRPGSRQWVDGDGNRLRFDPKDPSRSPRAEGGNDHYHYNDGDEHLQPGDKVPDPTPQKEVEETSTEGQGNSGPSKEMQNATEATGVVGTGLLILYFIVSLAN